jgi:hypothetical protein
MLLVINAGNTMYLSNHYMGARPRIATFHMEWFLTNRSRESLIARMKAKGWYTSMLQIFNAKGLEFGEYASILDPIDQELERHSEYKANASCLVTNIDVSGIKAKHILEGYKCDFIRPHFERSRQPLA